MVELIKPKKSWLERFKSEVTPQVKQGLIGAFAAVSIAAIAGIGGCVETHSENGRLKSKVHDFEMEVLPFRNLAVQEFHKADAESMKKLAELMITLRKDYAANLDTLNSNRLEIEQVKKEYSVQNYYAKMTNETFSVTDTNRVRYQSPTNGCFQCVFRLGQIPIIGSVQCYLKAGPPVDVPQFIGNIGPRGVIRNLVHLKLCGYPVSSSIMVQYVIDTNAPGAFQGMPPDDAMEFTDFGFMLKGWWLQSLP
jgi:hypothetical protein